MRVNFVFPMVWPTAVCRTLHAFSSECYYKACQVKKKKFVLSTRPTCSDFITIST